jgi:uncharacterized protein YaaQ
MHLVCAILADAQVAQVLDALTAVGHRATRVSSTGGFFRRGNTTLLIGVKREQLESVLALIRELGSGQPSGVAAAGATVFVLEVEQFQQM